MGGVPDLPLSAVSFLFSGIRVYGCKTVFSVSGFLSFFPHCLSYPCRVVWCRVVESHRPTNCFSLFVSRICADPHPVNPTVAAPRLCHQSPRTHFPPLPKPNSGFSLSGFFTCHMLYRDCVCKAVRMYHMCIRFTV